MSTASDSEKLWSFRRMMIVLIFIVLVVWFVVATNVKNSIAYPPWNNTMFMVGRMKEHLTPEYVASKIGPASPRDEVLLRTDWAFDEAMVQKIDMHPSLATPNKDGWGSLYYIVCDFNNDGQVPTPELMTVPPKPGATQKELYQPIAIFSAGPDGDPATWEDKMPPGFTR